MIVKYKYVKIGKYQIEINPLVKNCLAIRVYLIWAKRIAGEQPDVVGIATDEKRKNLLEDMAREAGYQHVLTETVETNHSFGKSMMKALSELSFRKRVDLDGE
jgi:hypothetical protein